MITTGPGRTRTADVVFAVVTAVVATTGVVFELRGSDHPVPPAAGGYAIAVVTGALLYWRRRAPLAISFGVLALCLLYHELGYPGLAPAIAMGVAGYAMAADAAVTRSLLIAVALILAVNAISLLPPWPTGIAWAVVGPAVSMVATVAAGETARVRRVAAEEQLRALRHSAEQDARNRLAEQRLDIAREVHDVLAHTVTVIGVQAAAAADALDTRPEEARAALAAVRGATKEAMAELRDTLVLLRTGEGHEVAPQPSLNRLSSLVDNAKAAGVEVTLTVTGEPAGLSAATGLAVYRVVQEALTNTIRHSRSKTAAVAVDILADEVVVTVTDDGPASPVRGTASPGHGLTGLRERGRSLGGTVDAGPAGTGFRVSARLPVGLRR
jgi:signal transduction histidine kinase